ncbi:MAG: pilus assembly FimT family protein [Planctomycetota bacterium]|jgi:prepilin-type N-terminal cleavage/methylation domain-containing protein
MPNARYRAYTLIELLIVIGLLGVAASLVMPRLVGRDSLILQAAVRQVIADLSFAQADALAHQGYRRVVFFDDGTGYALIRVTESTFNDPFDPADTSQYVTDPLASSAESGLYIVDFTQDHRFEGVTISDVAIDGSNRFVTFDALGGTVASGLIPGLGGLVDLTFDGASYRVNIEPFTGKLIVTKLS